ncbi:unnamed protein product [Lampetra fluviatilis]
MALPAARGTAQAAHRRRAPTGGAKRRVGRAGGRFAQVAGIKSEGAFRLSCKETSQTKPPGSVRAHYLVQWRRGQLSAGGEGGGDYQVHRHRSKSRTAGGGGGEGHMCVSRCGYEPRALPPAVPFVGPRRHGVFYAAQEGARSSPLQGPAESAGEFSTARHNAAAAAAPACIYKRV